MDYDYYCFEGHFHILMLQLSNSISKHTYVTLQLLYGSCLSCFNNATKFEKVHKTQHRPNR